MCHTKQSLLTQSASSPKRPVCKVALKHNTRHQHQSSMKVCHACTMWPDVSGCGAGSAAAAANGRVKASCDGCNRCKVGASAVAPARARGTVDRPRAWRARRLAEEVAALRKAILPVLYASLYSGSDLVLQPAIPGTGIRISRPLVTKLEALARLMNYQR